MFGLLVWMLRLSWFDFLLLCSRQTHIRCDYCDEDESLERGCRCTAAAVLLLCCGILMFLNAKLSGCIFCTKNTALVFVIVLCAYDRTNPTHRGCHKRVLL